MEKSHVSLLSSIVKTRLSFNRANDIVVDQNVAYSIDFFTAQFRNKEEKDFICLKGGGKEYSIHERALAGLRIARTGFKATTLDEFKDDPNGCRLQDVCLQESWDGDKLKTARFVATHSLTMKNQHRPEEFLYQDFCYEGARDYVKGVRALIKGKDSDFFGSREYQDGVYDLRDALYKTALKADKKVDKNIVRLPVFTISER
jgi:hypothetical protein